MAYDYDALYKSTADALGEPSAVFADFFANWDGPPLRVLDIGCGQGRDALMIARLGHSVIGVDMSPHGVRDMIAAAQSEGLPVTGVVADITQYTHKEDCDVLLIDRTLHMLSEPERLAVLSHLIGWVAKEGWALIADERANFEGFKRVFDESPHQWQTILDNKGNLFLRRAQD